MKDNTLKLDGGIEVYEHNVPMYADQYIREELGGDDNRVRERFPALLFYIRDWIEKPDNGDIEILDGLFGVYIRLCANYGVIPSLEGFSFLTGIHRTTFSDWAAGTYRVSEPHGNTVKKWKEICRAFLVEKLGNSQKPEVNLIFLGKAAYGMRETSPVPVEEITSGPELSRAEISARYQAFQEAPAPLELDEIE